MLYVETLRVYSLSKGLQCENGTLNIKSVQNWYPDYNQRFNAIEHGGVPDKVHNSLAYFFFKIRSICLIGQKMSKPRENCNVSSFFSIEEGQRGNS